MNGTTEKISRANKERERCEAKNKTFKYLSLWKEPPIHGFTDFCHIIYTLNIYIIKSFGRCFAYGMHLMGTLKPYFLKFNIFNCHSFRLSPSANATTIYRCANSSTWNFYFLLCQNTRFTLR